MGLSEGTDQWADEEIQGGSEEQGDCHMDGNEGDPRGKLVREEN